MSKIHSQGKLLILERKIASPEAQKETINKGEGYFSGNFF